MQHGDDHWRRKQKKFSNYYTQTHFFRHDDWRKQMNKRNGKQDKAQKRDKWRGFYKEDETEKE